jgi:uncharacterized Zn-binding protein involved in type VI secretion
MSRNWIVVGDTTASGGKVLAGSTSTFIDGSPLARQGDPVLCGQHGQTQIATGDPTTLDEGRPWAQHGDYCACGCPLVSAKQFRAFKSSGTGGGGGGDGSPSHQKADETSSSAPSAPSADSVAMNGGGPSSLASFLDGARTTPNYRYEEMNEPYQINQAAYLFAEGVGVAGAYMFKGHIVLRGSRLFVSAMGFTAASHIGDITYYLNAKVTRGGEILDEQPLTLNGDQLWPEGNLAPVGNAVFSLPEPTSPDDVTLELEGGYLYSAPEGMATPEPKRTRESFRIGVIKK